MVYYPETPAEALSEAIHAALGADPRLLDAFLLQAADISSGLNNKAKLAALTEFIKNARAQRGKALTAAQAHQLIALARATANVAISFGPPPCTGTACN